MLEDIARGIDEFMIRQPFGGSGGDRTLQLPRHDSLLVHCPKRPGLRQHLHRQCLPEKVPPVFVTYATHL